jgi:plasmid maintenance system killer protein
MTLQEAIKVIAIYDGWVYKRTLDGNDFYHHENVLQISELIYIGYSTSADALLPVRIKVIKDCSGNNDMLGSIFVTGQYILLMDYEQACIELATIIQQLNEKK